MNTFGLNSSLHVVTTKDSGNVPTEFNNIIHYYTSITRAMIYSHCEKLWANNTGAGLGRLQPEDYGAEPYDAAK